MIRYRKKEAKRDVSSKSGIDSISKSCLSSSCGTLVKLIKGKKMLFR